MRNSIHNSIFPFALLALLLTNAPEARSDGYAGYAGAFLRMGSGPVTMATGDAGVARCAGAEQASYNPAGLPYAPGNEVWIAWHNLSMDRTLGHFAALYQVPSVSFWGDPVKPIVLMPPKGQSSHPYAVYPNETRSRGVRSLRPEEYLPAIANAVLEAIENDTEVDRNTLLQLPGGPAEAGSLKPLLDETLLLAETAEYSTPEEIIDALRVLYQRTQKKPAALTITWDHAGTEDIQARDFDGIQTGTLGFYENRFSLAFGIKLHSTFSLGVSAGVLYALVPDLIEEGSSLTSTTFIADAGLQWRPLLEKEVPANLQTLTIGAAAYGLGGKNSWNTTGYWSEGTTKEDNYPDRYRIGFAYSPVASLSLYSDVETDLADLARYKGGLELSVMEIAGVSGGSSSSLGAMPKIMLRAGLDKTQPTFGLGLEFLLSGLGMTRLDYAYVMEDASPVATQVISWRFLLTR